MEFKIYSLCFLLFSFFIQVSKEATDQLSNNHVSDSTCTRDQCVKGDIVVNDVNEEDHAEHYKTDSNVIDDETADGDTERFVEVRNFEFPPLSRIDPESSIIQSSTWLIKPRSSSRSRKCARVVALSLKSPTSRNVGDIVDLELEEGKSYKRITRAIRPPVFEIPNYLSDKECNMIISAALDAGLERSGVVGTDIDEERQAVEDISQVSRVSEQTWLGPGSLPSDFWKKLVRRLSKLIQLPEEQIEVSEQMQVVSYVRGGHYHAHVDSSETKDKMHLPCCFQSPHCMDVDIYTEGYEQCCRICRYITVLYYLNDVEAGGETAFPLADMPDNIFEKKMTNKEAQSWYDLSHFCYNASLIVKPKRGTAIMWYNHYRDEDGYLGHVDERSHHGGCDIIKGNKWIANNWISCPNFRDRTKPSLVY